VGALQQFSDVPAGYKVLPPPSAPTAPEYSDVPDGYKILPPSAPAPPSQVPPAISQQPLLADHAPTALNLSPGIHGAELPTVSGHLNLGIPPQQSPDRASQLVSEQREQRAAQYPVQPPLPIPYRGATPEEVKRLEPTAIRLGGTAQPSVSPEEPAAVPVPVGPKFTEPGRATPQEAAADIENLKTITGYRGYGEIARNFPRPLTKGQLEGTEPLTPENEITAAKLAHVLHGTTTAATPLMVVGSILQPELTAMSVAGGYAGGKGAKKLSEAFGASPEVQDLVEQAGQIAGAFAGGAAFSGLKGLANPENALTDLLWKRGYIQDNNGHPIYITSQTEARAVAAELIKQNPQGIISSYLTKRGAEAAAENVPARQNMGVAEPTYSDIPRGYKLLPPAGEEKPVVHASNDVEELRASAERQAPAVGKAVEEATKGVPGAEVEAVRKSKDADRIGDKAERQGVQPSQVADISAAKVTVPDQEAAGKVLENLHGELPVQKAEGSVTGEPGKNAVRQVQAIVDTKAPAGEPVKKAEVLIQTPEMAKVTEQSHDDYRKAQELRAAGKEAEAAAIENRIAQTHEAAEQAARERQEADNAVQKPSTAGILQHPPEETGEAGRGRGRVEPSQQGEGLATARPETAKEEKAVAAPGRVTPSEYGPPKRDYLAEGGVPRENMGHPPEPIDYGAKVRGEEKAPIPPISQAENLRGRILEVRGEDGQWKRGKVLVDATTNGGNGEKLRRLRGVFLNPDGSEAGKFNNVKLQDVRREAAGGKQPEPAKQPAPVPGETVTRTSGERPEARAETPARGVEEAAGAGEGQPRKTGTIAPVIPEKGAGEKSTQTPQQTPAGAIYYHGTNNAEAIRQKGFSAAGEDSPYLGDNYAEGIYLSKSREPYEEGGQLEGISDVLPTTVSATNLKKVDGPQGVLDLQKEYSIQSLDENASAKLTAALKRDGYDGLDIGNEVVIFDPSKVSLASDTTSAPSKGAVQPRLGIDFDGTLFKENADGSIGAPIPERIASLKQDLADGKNVIIESRRASRPGEIENIHRALESVGLTRLPVTAKKDVSPELIGDKEKAQPGVKVERVETNANTPLPGTNTAEGAARHQEATRQAREKLGLKPGEYHKDLVKTADEIERGMRAPQTEQPIVHKYGNTQHDIPESSEAGKALDAARARISPNDLAGQGKEVEGNHVTVRYGIKGEDYEGIKKFLSQQAPFEASLGKTQKFPPSEHSDGAAVIIAPVQSPELYRINAEIQKHGDFAESSFPEYKPHATVAYVDPAKAARYVGMEVTNGKKFTIDSVTISKKDGTQEVVKLQGRKPGEAPRPQAEGGAGTLQQPAAGQARTSGEETSTAARSQEKARVGERGAAAIGAINPIEVAQNIKKIYDSAVKEFIGEKLKIGDKYHSLAKVDEDVAENLHLIDNAPRYFKAKADANVAKVIEGLNDDQIRLASLMVDSDSRDFLQAQHPDEYKSATEDPKVMAAVKKFDPLWKELTADRLALGWPIRRSLSISEELPDGGFHVIDRDGTAVEKDGEPQVFKTERAAAKFVEANGTPEPHLKRTYPEHSKNPLPAETGAGEFTGSFVHEKGLRPPKMDKKAREMSAAYHYEHGRKDFSGYIESFKQAKTAVLKQQLFDDFTEKAEKWTAGTAQPSKIEYNGETYYRPDIVQKAKEGGTELKPYAVYDPTRGERFMVMNPDEGWAVQATGKPGIKASDRFLGPKAVVDTMENYDATRGGEASKIRKFFQEQIVGLFGPMVHINNIVRRIGQASGLGAFDPRSWPSIAKVIASPELRERVMKGVDDATIDMLTKYGAYTDWNDIGRANQYIGNNLNPANWVRAFGKGVLFDPKFAGGWGGLDPKARVVVADYFKEHFPKMTDAEVARAVEDGFGNYNRANWTERQRTLAKFVLFPGWDTASVKWFLRHPFKVGVAGALVTLAINQALKALGKNKDEDATDLRYIHIGDRKLSSGLISDNMGTHLMSPVLGAIQAKLQGENVIAGATEEGKRGASALAGTLSGPVVEMIADQIYNRKYAGAATELVKPEDKYTPGTWAPNVELEKRIAFAALKGSPALNRFINNKGEWDWAQGIGGGVLGVTNYKYGAEERFKSNVAKAATFGQTLNQLAEKDPRAAAEFVKDPNIATYLMFHDDLNEMARDLKEIDTELERVRGSDLPHGERAKAIEDLKDNRNVLLKAADGLNDALQEARNQARRNQVKFWQEKSGN